MGLEQELSILPLGEGSLIFMGGDTWQSLLRALSHPEPSAGTSRSPAGSCTCKVEDAGATKPSGLLLSS